MNRISDFAQSALCSQQCLGCGDVLQIVAGRGLCDDCLKSLVLQRGPYCPRCGGVLDGVLAVCSKCVKEEPACWRDAIAVMDMSRQAKRLIHRFKYDDVPELARPLAHLAMQRVQQKAWQFDFIVPVPLHWMRLLWRGYNQADLLAEELSRAIGCRALDVLCRTRYTRQQAKLGKGQRGENLINAFSLKKGEFCRNATILLVDDVMTTGATLSAAAKTLLSGGAKQIYVLVVARR